MSATDVAAWVGAICGPGALLWDVYKWRLSGPKLEVSAAPGMVAMPHPMVKDREKYIVVTVRNNGTTATTITTISFATYDSWCARTRLKQSAAGVVPEPLSSQPIPYKLDVGEQWVGAVKQNEYVEELLRSGRLWCDIWHSSSKRPAQVRVKAKGS